MHETECGIRGAEFMIKAVIVRPATHERGTEIGEMCEPCLRWFSDQAKAISVAAR